MNHSILDPDGQPPMGFNASRRATRDVSEMLGIVRGLLADGNVSEAEVHVLKQWADQHPEAVSEWPGSKIYERLTRIYADGKVEVDELEDLRELLGKVVGGDAGMELGVQATTTLPLDNPPPAIVFPERLFVFTGKFAFGPRKACEAVIASFGGRCSSSVSKETNYVVIGTFGSRDWRESSHGTKILKAVEYKERGLPIGIVAEELWVTNLPRQ